MSAGSTSEGQVVGYRLFTVEPDGWLRGLWGARWPPDAPLVARHEPNPMAKGRASAALADAWAALRRSEKTVLLAAGAAIYGAVIAAVSRPAVGAVATAVVFAAGVVVKVLVRRGRPFPDAFAVFMQFGAVVTAIFAGGVAIWSAALGAWRNAAFGGGWAITLALAAAACRRMLRRFTGQWDLDHVGVPCPGNRTDRCGIYAFDDLGHAARDIRRPVSPLAAAQVRLWGRVWEHDRGWRGQYGRIEAVYDLGNGRGELSAALYRVPLLNAPDELAAGVARRAATPSPFLERLCGRLERFAARRIANNDKKERGE